MIIFKTSGQVAVIKIHLTDAIVRKSFDWLCRKISAVSWGCSSWPWPTSTEREQRLSRKKVSTKVGGGQREQKISKSGFPSQYRSYGSRRRRGGQSAFFFFFLNPTKCSTGTPLEGYREGRAELFQAAKVARAKRFQMRSRAKKNPPSSACCATIRWTVESAKCLDNECVGDKSDSADAGLCGWSSEAVLSSHVALSSCRNRCALGCNVETPSKKRK